MSTGDAYDFATLEANGVRDVALSPDQTLLYAAMGNGDVNVYDLLTRQKIATWDVGAQLGGISVSADGSFLLVVERGPVNASTVYRVDTATGAATTITTPGQAFYDVEIVDGDTALLTGGTAPNVWPPRHMLYNLGTGQFTSVANSVDYAGIRDVIVEDGHYSLLTEPGISSGPLRLFDDRTNTIVDSGYTPGFSDSNFGSQAISSAAGLVVQFAYYDRLHFYDLQLNHLRTVTIPGRADGVAFDSSGRYLFVYEIDSGFVAKYDIASWTRVDQYQVGTSDWHNDVGFGSQLLVSADGTRITIVDTDRDIGKLRIVDLAVRNEYFDGSSGADTFAGGRGDDTYLVDNVDDSVTELPHQGDDTVETSLEFYTLGANLERLIGISSSGQSLTGNSAANAITGGAGNDVLLGGAGDDVIHGMGGNDAVRGEDGSDQLFGDDGNDNLRGGRGVDSFDGGANDTVPNDISTYGDRVSFYELAATQGAVADLRTGIISNDGFGNAETMTGIESLGGDTAFVDTFYGNDNTNALLGSRGDNLHGFGGADVVHVNAAPGLADGGTGNDVLVLQSGGLWYLPDGNGDGLAESAAAMTEGWTVDLGAHHIRDGYGNSGTIQGFEAVIGSALPDAIFGDDEANVLNGMGGEDVIFGDGGNDTIGGGDGFDLLHGLDGDDLLSGEGGNDLLRGYAGVDHYDGGAEDGLDPELSGYGDRVSFFDPRATQGVVADLRTGIVLNDGYGNAETMTGIESLGVGTAFADTFYGNDSINALLAGLGDNLYGFGGDDLLQVRAAAAVIDGGSGTDVLALVTFPDYRPDSNGDGIAELGPDMTAGYTVDLAAGTLRDGNGATGTVTAVEQLVGSELADELRGDGADNRLDGGAGNDQLRSGTGIDTLIGGAGNDVLYFGSAFTGSDVADGGADRDVLVLQGNYTLTLSATNMVGIESFSLQSGAQTRWGDIADAFYDYDITMADANTPAGVQLIVNAQSLRADEDLTFDGSAESDGRFLVYAGHGVDDLTGGDGNDVFFFEGQRWGEDDVVDGGDGRDSVIISSGSGLNRVVFGEESFANIEAISVNARFVSDPSQKPSYELVLANGNVAPGGLLIVNGNSLSDAAQFVHFNGSAVQQGSLFLFGGASHDTLTGGSGADLLLGASGADALTGGAGADTFRYDAVTESVAGLSDVIGDFAVGFDKVDLSRIDANSQAVGDQAFAFIGSNAFSNTAGELRIVSSNGFQWAEGDVNGDGTADLVIGFQVGAAPLSAGDFIL